MNKPEEEEKNEQQHDEDDVVQGRVVAQVDDPEIAAGREAVAIVAAKLLEADSEKIEHLRESERDHDEGHAACAQTDRADQCRDDEPGNQRSRDMRVTIGDAVETQDADRIGADPDVESMAETDHRAVTENEIQAERREREDHHPGDQRYIERLSGEAGDNRYEGEQQDDREANSCPSRERGAAIQPSASRRRPVTHDYPCFTGNNPAGRTASTTAIRR